MKRACTARTIRFNGIGISVGEPHPIAVNIVECLYNVFTLFRVNLFQAVRQFYFADRLTCFALAILLHSLHLVLCLFLCRERRKNSVVLVGTNYPRSVLALAVLVTLFVAQLFFGGFLGFRVERLLNAFAEIVKVPVHSTAQISGTLYKGVLVIVIGNGVIRITDIQVVILSVYG